MVHLQKTSCLICLKQAQVHFKAMRKLAAEHQSEKVGEEIRKLYSWKAMR